MIQSQLWTYKYDFIRFITKNQHVIFTYPCVLCLYIRLFLKKFQQCPHCNYSILSLQRHKFKNDKRAFSQADHIPSAGSDDQDKLNFVVITGPVVSPTLGTLQRVHAPLCDSPSIMRPRRDRRPWEMKRG